MVGYIPKKGDIVWLNFEPSTGKEIIKRRPALTLSPSYYNRSGLAWFCPITSTLNKNSNLNVYISGEKVFGTILIDQLKSFDWRSREIVFIDKASQDIIDKAIENIKLVLEAEEL